MAIAEDAALSASTPYRFPYHLGIFLAVNALHDAYALIDGPDCLLRKAEWVHGKHDWHSTLLDVLGNHRVVATFVESEKVVKSKGEEVAVRIKQIDRVPGAKVVFVCSMPHVMIIGTQYDKILRRLQPEVKVQLLELPSRSLDGDWIDGYGAVLSALADSIDTSKAKLDPDKVAIIGYLMDRTEADHGANLQELSRLCSALGLSLCSVWLGNGGYDQLADAAQAGTIVALPSGLEAARTLAKRTGAKLVEAQTPFGPGRTIRFLRALGRATDRLELVEPFVESELSHWVPRLEWVVSHVFSGKRVAFAGSPDLFGGFLQLAGELGLRVSHLAAPAYAHHLKEDLAAEFGELPSMQFGPTAASLDAGLDGARPLDLIIGDSECCDLVGPQVPVVEFGFPSHYDHALYDRPYLGFTGWISFVDRMAQALSRGRRTTEMWRRSDGPRSEDRVAD